MRMQAKKRTPTTATPPPIKEQKWGRWHSISAFIMGVFFTLWFVGCAIFKPEFPALVITAGGACMCFLFARIYRV